MSSMGDLRERRIKKIMLMLIVICLIGAVAQMAWNDSNDHKQVWYLGGTGTNSDIKKKWVRDLCDCFLLLYSLACVLYSRFPICKYVYFSRGTDVLYEQ